jgi:O-antigen/teichoic acid export membrane protein
VKKLKKWSNLIRILGIATCLVGAFLMAFGEPFIGVNHSGIATVVVITGIGLIGTGNTLCFMGEKKEEP